MKKKVSRIHLLLIFLLQMLIVDTLYSETITLFHSAPFQSIEYKKSFHSTPRPIHSYLVRVDLHSPYTHFLVTPPNASQFGTVLSQTSSSFLRDNTLQIACNASYFIADTRSALDFFQSQSYKVLGFTSSNGTIYTRYPERLPTMYISESNQVDFYEASFPVYNAVSGFCRVLIDGSFPGYTQSTGNLTRPDIRNAFAVTEDGQYFLIFQVTGAVDRDQGVTLEEMAELLIQAGAYHAILMDGGDSTTLVIEGENGEPEILNSNWIELPVATHLGIWAEACNEY